ncbi:hypothetical protein Syun_022904 [Stephania yunnanensis]|uniref:Peptidase A1 domain-containing protein n=1 Tax=Stephania yunnanensis TaxID=152371 RepID=A0AAP0FEQ9_9MAGN
MGRIVQRVSDGVEGKKGVGGVMDKFTSSPIFPVRGNVYPDGLYYISLPIGNPPRPYYLDMDTGSDLTWIQCDAPCASCSKGPNPLYKPTRKNIVPSKDLLCAEVQDEKPGYCVSESCQECVYEIEYADNSSSRGFLVKDKLQQMIDNGNLLNSDFVFGCAYHQKGDLSLSPARTDGILGLSKAKISLTSQLARQGITRNVVGHCITNDKDSLGYMFLGDDFVPHWGMTWVPMLNCSSISFYQSKIVKINYGKLSLGPSDIDRTQVVFDTGSSYTYFPKEAYSSLISSVESFLGGGLALDESDPTLPVCWRANLPIRDLEDAKSFFKPLTLHFERKWWILQRTLQIPPEGYLVLSDKGNVCLGILDGSEVHDGSTIIIGDISLRGWLVVYDNVEQRIGWSRSDCTKPQNYDSDNLAFF